MDSAVQMGHEVLDLLGVMADVVLRSWVRERGGRKLVASRSPSHSEVYAARVQGLQHSKSLGHLEGAVVGEHDAAAADSNSFGARRDLPDHRLRARSGEVADAVVLRDPEALIAQPLRDSGKLDRLPQRIGRGAALSHGRLVYDAEP